MENPQEYYEHCGPMTSVDTHAADFSALPRDVAALCEVIQGVLIHRDMAAFAYGVTLSDERKNDTHVRRIGDVLARILALDHRPLTVARKPGDRIAGVCRHFSLMLCAILRGQGVPARVRCGFGAYFTSGKFEDHWACEYWNAGQARWILVDAQLDAVQRKVLHPDFDPLDVPRDRFIIAGDAWQMCQAGRAKADRFGLSHIAGLCGMWFIAGNVLRDLASLNRMELLPWDVWGLMQMHDAGLLDGEKGALLDRVAVLTLKGDGAFSEIRAIYQDDRFRVPRMVFNALRNAPEAIEASLA
ncbi:MAG: transglutaminase-like domain-containing protein [Candidatus Binataceae bacterium]